MKILLLVAKKRDGHSADAVVEVRREIRRTVRYFMVWASPAHADAGLHASAQVDEFLSEIDAYTS